MEEESLVTLYVLVQRRKQVVFRACMLLWEDQKYKRFNIVTNEEKTKKGKDVYFGFVLDFSLSFLILIYLFILHTNHYSPLPLSLPICLPTHTHPLIRKDNVSHGEPTKPNTLSWGRTKDHPPASRLRKASTIRWWVFHLHQNSSVKPE